MTEAEVKLAAAAALRAAADRKECEAIHPVMPLRERLTVARDALVEGGHAIYGALRGWRVLDG